MKFNKMKFDIGDKVRVKEDLLAGNVYDNVIFTASMYRYRGKCFTVDRVEHFVSGYAYSLKGIKYFYFSEDMLEPVENKKMTSYGVYKKFIDEIPQELKENIADIKPYFCPEAPYHIPGSICVRLKDGKEIIYNGVDISKKAHNEPVTDFNDIVNAIIQLAEKELIRANIDEPPFHSTCEGVGVLLKEKQETEIEYKQMMGKISELVETAFSDGDYKPMIDEVKNHAIYAAAELVQLIAMCDKLKAVE